MLAFYFSPGSSAMAPHIALHEIGAPFEPRPISFAKSEQRTAEYLKLNPAGKVPTLLIDGRALTEVAAILFYLGKRFPEAGLWPFDGDVEKEAQAVSWMSFIASAIHPVWRRSAEAAKVPFAVVEKNLGGLDWAMGGYSVVDIHLFRLYWRFVTTYGPEPVAFPGLTAHFERMMARPAVQKTIAIESALGYALPR